MSDVRTAKKRAAEALHGMTGYSQPEWRQAVAGDGDAPDCITPVCLDPDHERTDSSVYFCCSDLVIEVEAPEVGAYLVALLNADRGERA